MKLASCSHCERLVRVESPSCPFCGTRLGTTSALGRAMMTAVVGLSLTACVDKDDNETTAADGGSTAATTATTTTTTSPTIDTEPSSTTTASSTATSGVTSSSTSDVLTSSEGGHGFDAAGDTYTGPGWPTDPSTSTGGESSSGTTGDSSSSGSDGG